MEADFLELMPLTCTLAPRSSNSGIVGEASYGTAITPHCHVEYKTQQITNANGEERTQVGIVYLDGVYQVTTEWSLSVPIPGGTKAVSIIGVDQNTDEVGYHHTAVRFGVL